MSKKSWMLVFIVVIILIIIGIFLFPQKKEEIKEDKTPIIIKESGDDKVKNFNIQLIKNSFVNRNYLISPYSIEIALNMLREGADGNTKDEFNKVLGNHEIKTFTDNNKLYIANALFIKNYYQKDVLNTFTQSLKNNYHADILYDEFKTPDVINNWVNEKTNGMIPKILDNMSSEFVMGLANAISLDVKWQKEFECNNTKIGEFTKNDGSKIYVEMMHDTYKWDDYKYIKNDNMEGVILPYEKIDNDTNLEFMAIMPKSINELIQNLDDDTLNNLDKDFISASDKLHINLSLPRFTYSDEISDLISVLRKMGINDVFNPVTSDLSKIISKNKANLYVDTAIHKTKIELNEKGTKAAAVTYFGIKNTALLEEDYKEVDINFNKPFIYMIRDSKTKDIIFFGSVYEPNLWKGTTCE